jgi:chaperone required for assembly of F1-ATPase
VQWAEKRFAIKLVMVAGIMPSPQSEQTLRALKARLAMLDDFPLTAVWMMAKYTGSLLLALALWERAIAVDDAFAASRLEETFQNSQWGEDEEAARRRDATAVEMTILAEFISLIQ